MPSERGGSVPGGRSCSRHNIRAITVATAGNGPVPLSSGVGEVGSASPVGSDEVSE